jgi:hypothetical protein
LLACSAADNSAGRGSAPGIALPQPDDDVFLHIIKHNNADFVALFMPSI